MGGYNGGATSTGGYGFSFTPTFPGSPAGGGIGGSKDPGSVSSGGWGKTVADILAGVGSGGTKGGTAGAIANGGVQLIKQIAPLFQTDAAGEAKIMDTKTQQMYEAAINNVVQGVANGTLSKDVAIVTLNNLNSAAGPSPGGQAVKATIALAIARLTEDRKWDVMQLPDKNSPQGMGMAQPGLQTAQVKQAMLNKLMGYKVGDDALAGTGIGKAIDTTKLDPMQRFNDISATAPDKFPVQPNTGFQDFRKKLATKLGGWGG